MWAQLGKVASGTVGGYMQQKKEAERLAIEDARADEAASLQREALEADIARNEAAEGDARHRRKMERLEWAGGAAGREQVGLNIQREREAELLRRAVSGALTKNEDGTTSPNEEALEAALTAINPETGEDLSQYRAEALKMLNDLHKSFLDVQTAEGTQQDAARKRALGSVWRMADLLGGSPEAIEAGFALLEENNVISKQRIEGWRDFVLQDPEHGQELLDSWRTEFEPDWKTKDLKFVPRESDVWQGGRLIRPGRESDRDQAFSQQRGIESIAISMLTVAGGGAPTFTHDDMAALVAAHPGTTPEQFAAAGRLQAGQMQVQQTRAQGLALGPTVSGLPRTPGEVAELTGPADQSLNDAADYYSRPTPLGVEPQSDQATQEALDEIPGVIAEFDGDAAKVLAAYQQPGVQEKIEASGVYYHALIQELERQANIGVERIGRRPPPRARPPAQAPFMGTRHGAPLVPGR